MILAEFLLYLNHYQVTIRRLFLILRFANVQILIFLNTKHWHLNEISVRL